MASKVEKLSEILSLISSTAQNNESLTREIQGCFDYIKINEVDSLSDMVESVTKVCQGLLNDLDEQTSVLAKLKITLNCVLAPDKIEPGLK